MLLVLYKEGSNNLWKEVSDKIEADLFIKFLVNECGIAKDAIKLVNGVECYLAN